jgi:hypothetical protein
MSQEVEMTNALLVGLFWLAAAAVVGTAHTKIDPFSVVAGSMTSIAAIFVCACCYMRGRARRTSGTHALGVGTAWLVLAIATEMAMTAHLGHGWSGLIGTPDHALLRNVFLFVWVFAPTFFAQRDIEE